MNAMRNHPACNRQLFPTELEMNQEVTLETEDRLLQHDHYCAAVDPIMVFVIHVSL